MTNGHGSIVDRSWEGRSEDAQREDEHMSPAVLAVYNQKGGAGKSVSTANLARALSGRELARRVLVLELDKQANCSLMLGVNPSDYDAPMTRVFEGARARRLHRADRRSPGSRPGRRRPARRRQQPVLAAQARRGPRAPARRRARRLRRRAARHAARPGPARRQRPRARDTRRRAGPHDRRQRRQRPDRPAGLPRRARRARMGAPDRARAAHRLQAADEQLQGAQRGAAGDGPATSPSTPRATRRSSSSP